MSNKEQGVKSGEVKLGFGSLFFTPCSAFCI